MERQQTKILKGEVKFAKGRPIIIALLLSLAIAAGTQAAEFGVNRGNPPPGYFMLCGPNSIQAGLDLSLGDIPDNIVADGDVNGWSGVIGTAD